MYPSNVTFATVRRLLESLGFEMGNAMGSHRVFLRGTDGSLLLFPPLGPTDPVDPLNLAAASRLLDERGIIPRNEFLDRLRQTNGVASRPPGRRRRAAGANA